MSSLDASRNTVKHPASQETGFFIFRNLIKGIPLAAEGEEQHVKIKYFELWNDNLYIGTTAAEILHFVGIPPDPGDELGQPSFILASRSCMRRIGRGWRSCTSGGWEGGARGPGRRVENLFGLV